VFLFSDFREHRIFQLLKREFEHRDIHRRLSRSVGLRLLLDPVPGYHENGFAFSVSIDDCEFLQVEAHAEQVSAFVKVFYFELHALFSFFKAEKLEKESILLHSFRAFQSGWLAASDMLSRAVRSRFFIIY